MEGNFTTAFTAITLITYLWFTATNFVPFFPLKRKNNPVLFINTGTEWKLVTYPILNYTSFYFVFLFREHTSSTDPNQINGATIPLEWNTLQGFEMQLPLKKGHYKFSRSHPRIPRQDFVKAYPYKYVRWIELNSYTHTHRVLWTKGQQLTGW